MSDDLAIDSIHRGDIPHWVKSRLSITQIEKKSGEIRIKYRDGIPMQPIQIVQNIDNALKNTLTKPPGHV